MKIAVLFSLRRMENREYFNPRRILLQPFIPNVDTMLPLRFETGHWNLIKSE